MVHVVIISIFTERAYFGAKLRRDHGMPCSNGKKRRGIIRLPGLQLYIIVIVTVIVIVIVTVTVTVTVTGPPGREHSVYRNCYVFLQATLLLLVRLSPACKRSRAQRVPLRGDILWSDRDEPKKAVSIYVATRPLRTHNACLRPGMIQADCNAKSQEKHPGTKSPSTLMLNSSPAGQRATRQDNPLSGDMRRDRPRKNGGLVCDMEACTLNVASY